MSHPKETERGRDAYKNLVAEVATLAATKDANDTASAKLAATEYVQNAKGRKDENRFLTGVLTYSPNGPHNSWQDHEFDTSDPDDALRALAASALASDVLNG